MDDAKLVAVMTAADERAAAMAGLEAHLKRGRMDVAFTKLRFSPDMTPLTLAYAPAEFEPRLVVRAVRVGGRSAVKLALDSAPPRRVDAPPPGTPGDDPVSWIGLAAHPSLGRVQDSFRAALQHAVAAANAAAEIGAHDPSRDVGR
jgi:hypothetical protein